MSDDLIYQLSLELTPGIGPKLARQLIAYSGSGSGVINSTKKKLLKVPGIGIKTIDLIKTNFSLSYGEKVMNQCSQLDIHITHFTDHDFPSRLKNIYDAPNFLFSRGNIAFNTSKTVAIVGTRKATSYGKQCVEQLVSDLAQFNTTILSGLAYGIDIHAHRCALKSEIPTVGVIAGGIDKIYPSTHRKVAEEMMIEGGIASESLPGTKPDPHLFPLRNRLIAGMADATIIVEAAEKGGALITAQLADSYNRPVFAVPGNLTNEYSKGTNQLIASQKAIIYTKIDDLVAQLNWDLDFSEKRREPQPELSTEEKRVYEFLQLRTPAEIDEIAFQTSIPINQTASVLLALEFKNLVRPLPGKKYELTN